MARERERERRRRSGRSRVREPSTSWCRSSARKDVSISRRGRWTSKASKGRSRWSRCGRCRSNSRWSRHVGRRSKWDSRSFWRFGFRRGKFHDCSSSPIPRNRVKHRCMRSRDDGKVSGPASINPNGKSSCSTCATLFVDNVSREATKKDLERILVKFGAVKEIFISRKTRFNHPLSFALVEFENSNQVDEAAKAIHGRWFLRNGLFAGKAKYSRRPIELEMAKKVDDAGQDRGQSGRDSPVPGEGHDMGKLEDAQKGNVASVGKLCPRIKSDGNSSPGMNTSPLIRIGELDVLVDVGCSEIQIELMESAAEISNRRQTIRICIRNCCNSHGVPPAKAKEVGNGGEACVAPEVGASEDQKGSCAVGREGEGNLGCVAPNSCCSVNSQMVPYWYNLVSVPTFGYYWSGYPVVGYDHATGGMGSGWGGDWHSSPSPGGNFGQSLGGSGHVNSPPNCQIAPGVSVQNLTTGEKWANDHNPVPIRELAATVGVSLDPVVEEILSNDRVVVEDARVPYWKDKGLEDCFKVAGTSSNTLVESQSHVGLEHGQS